MTRWRRRTADADTAVSPSTPPRRESLRARRGARLANAPRMRIRRPCGLGLVAVAAWLTALVACGGEVVDAENHANGGSGKVPGGTTDAACGVVTAGRTLRLDGDETDGEGMQGSETGIAASSSGFLVTWIR